MEEKYEIREIHIKINTAFPTEDNRTQLQQYMLLVEGMQTNTNPHEGT